MSMYFMNPIRGLSQSQSSDQSYNCDRIIKVGSLKSESRASLRVSLRHSRADGLSNLIENQLNIQISYGLGSNSSDSTQYLLV